MADSHSRVEGAAVDMGEVLHDMTFPVADLSSLDFISGGDAAPQSRAQQKDLFAVQKRKSWDKSTEARCDFSYKLRLTRRSNVNFFSIWQKSVYGRTLTDIKADPDMVRFFADSIVPVIREMLGFHLNQGGWCICTSPKRRHKTKNFATRNIVSTQFSRSMCCPKSQTSSFSMTL